jgi:hypothetical protein
MPLLFPLRGIRSTRVRTRIVKWNLRRSYLPTATCRQQSSLQKKENLYFIKELADIELARSVFLFGKRRTIYMLHRLCAGNTFQTARTTPLIQEYVEWSLCWPVLLLASKIGWGKRTNECCFFRTAQVPSTAAIFRIIDPKTWYVPKEKGKMLVSQVKSSSATKFPYVLPLSLALGIKNFNVALISKTRIYSFV